MTALDVTRENRVVMFMDVHHFSTAFNAVAGNPHDFLQAMYAELGDIIVAHQGEIVKYLGDAMLCLFPAHSENEAVACALKLRRAFADLVNKHGLPTETELEVGIDSGEVVTGIFGHQSLRLRDVFGEEVNRAATIGHHRGIAVTEHVLMEIEAAYPTRPLPDFKVKWQAAPLKLWEVVE